MLGKDLNDVLRGMDEAGRMRMAEGIKAAAMRSRASGRGVGGGGRMRVKRKTFYLWLRSREVRVVYPLAWGYVEGRKERRPRRSRCVEWERFFARADEGARAEFKGAFETWRGLL